MALQVTLCALLGAAGASALASTSSCRGSLALQAGLAGPQTNPTPLQNGGNLLDSTTSRVVQWYGGLLTPTFNKVTVAVVPIVGNPNLYAYVGQLGTPPVVSYSSTSSTGIDVIKIRHNDSAVLAACTTFWNAGQDCAFFMSVDPGARIANYSISYNDGSIDETLIAEYPSVGSVLNDNLYDYYQLAAAAATPTNGTFVSFTVSPLGGYGRFGVPILTVSTTNSKPDPNNASTYCAQSNTGGLSGLETLVFTTGDACYCNGASACTYFVTVSWQPNGPARQDYSITPSLSNAPIIPLINGQQASGEGTNSNVPGVFGGTPVYQLNALFNSSTARVLRIIETPLAGAVNVFVTVDGTTPSLGNFQFQATRFSGENELEIRWDDPILQQYCGAAINASGACAVKIAVVTITQKSSFQITATLGTAYRLTAGLSVEDATLPGDTVYYYMPDSNYGGAFQATLAVQSGQGVRLLVGSDQVPGTSMPNPNVTSSYCKSTIGFTTSPAVISIPPTDPCFCSNLTMCNYYVSVYSDSYVEYTVLAKYVGGYSLLQLNVPFVDVVSPSVPTAVNFYAMWYPDGYNRTGASSAASLTINMDAVPGAGQLQLSAGLCMTNATCNWTRSSFPIHYGPFTMDPTLNNLQLVVRNTDANYTSQCGIYIANPAYAGSFCAVRLAVMADPTVLNSAIYTLTPFGGARQLVDSQVVTASAPANGFVYYRYSVVDLRRPLKITVAALQGNPELYVSLGQAPNETSYDFVSLTAGVEAITITWDSRTIVAALAARGLRTPFDAIIAVEGEDGPATFNIEATTSNLTQLQVGQPVGGAAGPTGFAYYLYTVPANQTFVTGFRLTLTPIAGPQPVVFVNSPVNPGPNGYPLLPRCSGAVCTGSFSNYVASTLNSVTNNFVDIEPGSALYAPGLWAIGVYCGSASTFEVVVSAINSAQTLADGVPVAGIIYGANYSYYKLNVFKPFTSILLTMQQTTAQGSPLDLIASTNYVVTRPTILDLRQGASGAPYLLPTNKPGIFGSLQSARPIGDRNLLNVPGANLTSPNGLACNFENCAMVFSVAETFVSSALANLNASYSIKANILANASYSVLPAGTPSYGILTSNSVNYYTLSVIVPPGNNAVLPVTVTLSPIRFNTDVYITLDGSTPSPTNSQYNATAASGVDYIYIGRNAINAAAVNKTTLVINVAVQVGVLPVGSTASYYISWIDQDPNVVTQLLNGVPLQGRIPSQTFAYYYYSQGTPDATTDVTFSLTNNAGDASLYMSQWSDVQNNTNFRPGPGGACANSTNNGADWIIIPSAGSNPFGPDGGTYAAQCRCTTYPCNYILAVSCDTAVACAYVLTGVLGDVTPLRISEGQALSYPVRAKSYVYYYFDTTPATINGRTVVISVSKVNGPGNALAVATNTYVPYQTDPSLLPNAGFPSTFLWSSSAQGPVGPQATITISQTDPVMATCNLTVCPLLVFGVYTDWQGADVTTMRVAWYAQGGLPLTLAWGIGTGWNGLQAGQIRSFIVYLTDLTKDVYILAQTSYGRVAVSFDNDPSKINCRSNGGSPGPTITCDSLWSAITATGTNPPVTALNVSAANPCASSSRVNPACDAGAWRAGPYFINVLAIEDSQFSLLASQVSTPVLLVDSSPQSFYTTAENRPLYEFRTFTQISATAFPVAFYVTAGAVGVTLYINQCQDGQCTTTSKLPGPGQNQNQQSFTVSPGVTQVLQVTLGNSGYCTVRQGSYCHYYISVFPTTACSNANCRAPFTIMASVLNGALPIQIAFSSINQQVALTTGIIPSPPASPNQLLEVYLDPSSGPSDVTTVVDSCGPGYPVLYACNPDTSGQSGGCTNPFKPSGTSYTNVAQPQAFGGRGLFKMQGVNGNAVFMNLAVDPLSGGKLPAYQFMMSARSAYYLNPGTTFNVFGGIELYLVGNTSDIKVVWPQSVIYDQNGGQVATAVGVQYLVYVAVGGFNATRSGAVTVNPVVNSPCALNNWAVNAAQGSQVLNVSTNTSALVVNLAAFSYYEINIVSSCDYNCFVASLGPVRAASLHGMSSFRVSNGRISRTATGQTLTQQAPYLMANFQTAANNNPVPTRTGPGLGLIIGASVGGALFLCCCVGGALYYRRRRRLAVPKEDIKADDRAKRVAQLGLGAASASIQSPSPSASASAAELTAARSERAAFDPVAPTGAGGNVAGWK